MPKRQEIFEKHNLRPSRADRITMLRQNVELWTRWKSENPGPVSLQDAYLNDASLVNVDLSGADLGGAYLNKANLTKANLSHTNLEKVALVNACLDGADLQGASLNNANLANARLRGANLTGADLRGANLQDAVFAKATLAGVTLQSANALGAVLRGANLRGANLSRLNLSGVDLVGADLRESNLSETVMVEAKLSHAKLGKANLSKSNLMRADLVGANLESARLEFANLVGSNLSRANLSGSSVYGVCAWDVNIEGCAQLGLRITPSGDSSLTPLSVDDLEMAQFVYMLMCRQKLRNVLTTLGDKAVLILGRFTERKELLDRIANKLRELGFLPMIFDFERPTDRDLTETVKILAGLSRFVIADITNPSSVPYELGAIVPDYMVPFITILERGQLPFSMFNDLPLRFHWALPLLLYRDADSLVHTFEEKIVKPALEKGDAVRRLKATAPLWRSAEE